MSVHIGHSFLGTLPHLFSPFASPLCLGDYTLEIALADMEAAAAKKGKTVSAREKDDFSRLFTECYNAVDSKQLRPMVRTQYMRTAFQVRSVGEVWGV